MRKYILLITLVMVLLLSAGVSAYDYYVTASEDFANMINTADIENAVGYGEGQYNLEDIASNLWHYAEFKYGIYQDGELSGSLNSSNGKSYFDINLKHKFMEKNDWQVSGQLAYFYNNGGNDYPVIGVLSNKELKSDFVLYNNLFLELNTTVGKRFQNGFIYNFDKSTLKVNLESYTFDQLNDFAYHMLQVGLQSAIDEKITYTAYVQDYSTTDTLLLSNTIEYQVKPDLKVTGNFKINTGTLVNNDIYFQVEKELANSLTLAGGYKKELDSDSQRFIAKVSKILENGATVYGQYNNLNGDSGIGLGINFKL